MKLVIHPISLRYLKATANNPPHGLLLEGPNGIGKGAVAHYLAGNVLDVAPDKLGSYAYLRRLDSRGSISIDDIRELNHFVKLKIPGSSDIRRVVIVEHAQQMTLEAQNAFLKLLEEPPADTVIILTANNARQLLPTIVSRVSVIKLAKPAKTDTTNYFMELGYKDKDIAKAYALSGGLPGLMAALLDDTVDTPVTAYISDAKELLSLSNFERLNKIDALIKQKEDIPLLVDALSRVAYAALSGSIESGKSAQAQRWHKISSEIAAKQKDLAANPNSKLMLTDLVMNL